MWPALSGNITIEIFFGIMLGLKWWRHALTICSKGHLSIDWKGSLNRRWKLTSKSVWETALKLLFWAPNCVPPSAKICLLKKPLSICQFGWREIWNAFPASNSLNLSGGPVSSRVALPSLYFECFVLQSLNMSGELLTFPLRPSTSISALLCRRYYRGLNYVCRRRVLNRKHNFYKYSLAALNDWSD